LPSPSGGVGFEWHEGGANLEIEVLHNGNVQVCFEDPEKDHSEDLSGSLANCAGFVRECIQARLTER
jgi:hypothetical protein